MPSAVTSPLEPARRKRGRPRKYGTPEQAMAAKKTASVTSKERREQQQLQQLALGGAGSSKKYQLVGLGLTIVIWPTPYPCIGQLSG
ncbi:hypothetical protein V6N13_147951 [Hibiscus sabdariffa]|uniref:AT-hook motif nuclear-localized protein n=1 Tax=Hibiscus sabdariffa TaxID=183260 RepID=A0ABR2TX37_9ROSI